MFWVVPALVAPVLWAGSNLVDEHLITRADRSPATLLLVAGLFGSVPAIYVALSGNWMHCEPLTVAVAMVGGALGVLVYYPYYMALRFAAPSAVILMWNLSPVLIMGIAHIAVGERLSTGEYLSIGLLVASSALASITEKSGRNRRAVPWMALASVLLALSSVAEKFVYDRLPFLAGFGWLSLGAGAATTSVALISATARKELVGSLRNRLSLVFIGNEVLDLGAVSALNLATSLASVSVVHAIGGLQPLFILLIERALPRKTVARPLLERLRTVVAAGLAVVGLGLLRY